MDAKTAAAVKEAEFGQVAEDDGLAELPYLQGMSVLWRCTTPP